MTEVLIGLGALIVSVGIQVAAVVVMLQRLHKISARGRLGRSGWNDFLTLSVVMVVLFLGHLVQIGIWAALFVYVGEFNDFTTAFYHSTVNFASLGYGDIVMSEKWRLLGALEAGNGVLMFGLSAAAMFAVLTWLIKQYDNEKGPSG